MLVLVCVLNTFIKSDISMPPKTRGRGRGRGVPAARPPGDYPPPGHELPRQEPEHYVSPQRQELPPAPGDARREEVVKPKPQALNSEELGMKFEKLSVAAPALPRRPGEGKLGRPIKLLTNNFPIDIPSGNVYHYDVEIVSKGRVTEQMQIAGTKQPVAADKKYRCMSTKRNREVVCQMLKGDSVLRGFYPAYDGRKNLYTRRPLQFPGPTLKVKVEMLDDVRPGDEASERQRPDVFEVIIQPVKKKATNSCAVNLDQLHEFFEGRSDSVNQDVLMAIETVMRNGPCMRLTPVGRSFFYLPNPDELYPLGGGREIWFGYHQSVRLGQWKPLVNIDITATAFYQKCDVIQYVVDILNVTRDALKRVPMMRDADIVKLTKELKGLWIEVNHLRYPRKYKVLKATRESARDLEFSLVIDGKNVKTTVAKYFMTNYNRKLEFPQLPCLQVGPETKKVFLPIEVCNIKQGQHCKKPLEEKQNAEMIKYTAVRPNDRFKKIRDIMKGANFNQDPYMKEFGIKVVCEPMKLEGRVLHPPNVRYKGRQDKDQKFMPTDGKWDLRDKKFLKGAIINKWLLISFAQERFCGYGQLENFAKLLTKIGLETGIDIGYPETIEIYNPNRDRVTDVLPKLQKKFLVDLIVIVIPNRNKVIYADAKQVAETDLGLVTQCVKDDNVVKKCNPALVSNLCQKINAKMGGVNNGLVSGEKPSILEKPVIIIGADVTHPGPSTTMKPSLAAAVGSLDSFPSRYAVTCRAQTNVDSSKNAIEMILDLKEMVKYLLKAFYKHTKGKKPEKIIFYRDGVSEGQFDKVRDHEVKCIREACRELSADYEPGLTFIVVQKRHHTRFIPAEARDGCGRPGNVPPGTTVDTKVTHPLNFDFFLCSHFGLQGTSRPGHYTVIEDDNEMSADDLQKLTYYLCYTYVRCTKSISIPSPVAYAHLAAFRARQHYLSQHDESSGSSDISTPPDTLPQAVMDSIKVVDTLDSTMYFV